ncbi:MAG: biopolymer transporter ExbD [Gammaproteobacteria bacterium]
MRHGRRIIFLVAALVMASMLMRGAASEAAARDIRITLMADGEHCLVSEVTILCSELSAYLRDTLKLPQETTIHLQAARAASYQSVRTVLDIIEKSGFSHAIGYLAEP